jgi:multidrug efflux pump subunit AcrB
VLGSPLPRLDQYKKVILKANAEGEIVRLKDVAKLEAGW